MKIGLLGGSFNPVHNAHLRIADGAQQACGLERVIFIPAADPPHKILAGDVSFAQRAQMVRLAIAGRADYELSLLEEERGGKSYSIDTIAEFRSQRPDSEIYFIIGGDSFLDIGTWHRYQDIFASCNLIVVERPGHPVTDPFHKLPMAVKCHFTVASDGTGSLKHESGSTVHFITGAPLDLSSTEIRRRAAGGIDITRLVPADVAAYISHQRIYHQCQ